MKIALSLATALTLAAAAGSFAHDGHDDEDEVVGAHGGVVAPVGSSHRLELAFSRSGVRIFVDAAGTGPVDLRGSSGSVRVSEGQQSVTGELTFVASTDGAHFACALDLARIQEGALVTVTLDPLDGKARTVEAPFRIVRQGEWLCARPGCGKTSPAPGTCECKAAIIEHFFVHGCGKHSGVTSDAPGQCWIDQSSLGKRVVFATRAPSAWPATPGAPAHGHGHGRDGDDHDHGHGHGH